MDGNNSKRGMDTMATKKAAKKATTKKVPTKKATTKKASTAVKKKATKTAAAEDVNLASDASLEQETPSTLKKAAKKPAKAKKPTKKEQAAAKEMNELMEKWMKLKELDHEIPTKKYKMTDDYGVSTPIEHPSLGWGFILSVQNNRLEVLFESGIKMLISNYKG